MLKRLTVLLVLVLALAASLSAPQARAFSACEEQCEAEYSTCMLCSPSCFIGYQQWCWNRYNACLDRCPIE